MNSVSFTSSLLFPYTGQQHRLYNIHPKLHTSCIYKSIQFSASNARSSLACAKIQLEEGLVPVMDLEELGEKDWSFLKVESMKSKHEHDRKVDQIISAGNVVDISKILVSMGSDDFVNRLIESSPSQLLFVVHESFLTLACIKEMHDEVKCWQGGFISAPEKWALFDVVFLYYLPAFPFKLEETFKALACRCAPGARVVISHLQGRQGLEQERRKYPDNVVSDLPDKSTLESVASNHSFRMKEYIDDPNFYLAVLAFKP
ncbi:hypothetical protein RND81_14G056800 [Saponaria officinalis]|uniref:Uncharacterized protein n=1 Tax=Saponaria officinalis TaxID=3572 RepID=A0AAW1GIY2_SAPOF